MQNIKVALWTWFWWVAPPWIVTRNEGESISGWSTRWKHTFHVCCRDGSSTFVAEQCGFASHSYLHQLAHGIVRYQRSTRSVTSLFGVQVELRHVFFLPPPFCWPTGAMDATVLHPPLLSELCRNIRGCVYEWEENVSCRPCDSCRAGANAWRIHRPKFWLDFAHELQSSEKWNGQGLMSITSGLIRIRIQLVP